MRTSTRGTSRLSLALALSGFILLAGCFEDNSKDWKISGDALNGTQGNTP